MASRSSPRRALVAAFLGNAVEWHSVMPDATPAPAPDMDALAAEVAGFLESAPIAEALGAKLHRLLQGFLLGDVLSQAERFGAPAADRPLTRLPGAPLEVSPPMVFRSIHLDAVPATVLSHDAAAVRTRQDLARGIGWLQRGAEGAFLARPGQEVAEARSP